MKLPPAVDAVLRLPHRSRPHARQYRGVVAADEHVGSQKAEGDTHTKEDVDPSEDPGKKCHRSKCEEDPATGDDTFWCPCFQSGQLTGEYACCLVGDPNTMPHWCTCEPGNRCNFVAPRSLPMSRRP